MSFQVNLNVVPGTGFSQDFYLANPDKSPMDITGCTFTGYISKWPGAYIARESTSTNVVHNYVEFTGSVSSGTGGVYNLSLSPEISSTLEEGKHTYSVKMTDVNGTVSQVLQGLVFATFSL
jgi:hypothetical protein